MDPFAVAMIALLFLGALFIWTLITSRGGQSRTHRLAFYSGLVGLVAIPCWVVGLVGLLAQFFFGTFMSPSGILLITSTIVLVLAASTCVYSQIHVRRRLRSAA